MEWFFRWSEEKQGYYAFCPVCSEKVWTTYPARFVPERDHDCLEKTV